MLEKFNFYADPFPTLNVEVACDVALYESSNASVVTVEIEGDNIEGLDALQFGEDIYISQVKAEFISGNVARGSTGISIEGNGIGISIGSGTGKGISISSTGIGINISSGGSGKILVNGQEVNLSSDDKTYFLPRVKIFTPPADLKAQLYGVATLSSQVKLRNTLLSAHGSAKAELTTARLDVNTLGSSEIKAILEGGDLKISTSGSSDIEILGHWARTSINVLGSGKIVTRGHCLGDYEVNASGAGSVVHHGSVSGRVCKNASGAARVRVG